MKGGWIYIKTKKYDFKKIFAPESIIIDDFQKIWTIIIEEIDEVEISVKDAVKEVKELIIYDALDGGRTTLTCKPFINKIDDVPLFSIALIHTLRVLGAKSCVIMVHTSYNRERGPKDFERVLRTIKSGTEIVKQYSITHAVRCRCLCLNEDYEFIDIIRDTEQQTQNGTFNAHFLFDYNEKWFITEKGRNILNTLPEINVHIRHTKFNFSGGWIPDKMKKSAFLYSQNGTVYSNWEPDELVALVAMALLAKKLNEREGLSKLYSSFEEIEQRYKKREIELFQKTVQLKTNPKKLFSVGSPIGVYQIYY